MRTTSRRMPATCWSAGSNRSPSRGAWASIPEIVLLRFAAGRLRAHRTADGSRRYASRCHCSPKPAFGCSSTARKAFTPDDRYLLGESPDVAQLFVAAGFNSIGIQSAGGAGKVLAEWIVDGRPPMDLWDVDVRRVMPFQSNRSYLHDRTVEGARPAVRDALAISASRRPRVGCAVRPSMTALPRAAPASARPPAGSAPTGCAARDETGLPVQLRPPELVRILRRRAQRSRAQAATVRPDSFGKFCLQGPTRKRVLNRICANDIADILSARSSTRNGSTSNGGIEADLTVTRIGGAWISDRDLRRVPDEGPSLG